MQNWVRPRDAWIQKHKSGGTTIISEPFGVLFQCTHSIQKQPVMRKYHKELRKGSMPCQMLQCLVASPRGHLDACRFQCQLSLQCWKMHCPPALFTRLLSSSCTAELAATSTLSVYSMCRMYMNCHVSTYNQHLFAMLRSQEHLQLSQQLCAHAIDHHHSTAAQEVTAAVASLLPCSTCC